MGSTNIDGKKNGYLEEALNRWSPYITCFSSFLISIVGGLVLVYWRIRFHPSNRQLWMVPFGLVMFATPLLVWFISLASDTCCPKEQQQLPLISEQSQLASGSATRSDIHDPER